jgi:DNA-binding Xre family transcriptional regulator
MLTNDDSEKIKNHLTLELHKLFIRKFNGNKSLFARVAGVNESTIRDIFNTKRGMTLHIFFKLCYALQVDPSELMKDIIFSTKETPNSLDSASLPSSK